MKEISAGGLVYKQDKDKRKVYVLLIEDKYLRLTLPKGKQEQGETLEQTAIREVREETGIIGEIREDLGKVYYEYRDYIRGHIYKEVTYFLIEALGGELKAQEEEINKVGWYDLEELVQLQNSRGYDNNQQVLETCYQKLSLLLGETNG